MSYGPVRHKFYFDAFSGRKDIRTLVAYPMRFAVDHERLKADLNLQGEKFKTFADKKHVFCEGWTVKVPPLGRPDDDLWSQRKSSPTHIESDVIIDVAEALRKKVDWRMHFGLPSAGETTSTWLDGSDNTKLLHWFNFDEKDKSKAKKPLFEIVEVTQRSDDAEEKVKQAGIDADKFLKAWQKGPVRNLVGLDEDINTLLLPRRLSVQDIIRGKGSGLFILLHGVPGVGKTATAEAVAQANSKPLFTIACGDLGLDPENVEERLMDIFRLAHIWDCVLLLDEADIFLARRDNFNLQRNALVSVFLRVLEYYSGILFLTTNRVGLLDEAFKSRIHISLYYEPLSRDQTVDIFRFNIQRLRDIEKERQFRSQDSAEERPKLLIKAKKIVYYAKQYFDNQEDTPHLRWNGRQIRNAFQIATSLAQFKAFQSHEVASMREGSEGFVLDETQFVTVAEAIEKFGNYMDYTRAKTDSDEARLDSIRADDITNEKLASMNRGYNTFSPASTQRHGGSAAQAFRDQPFEMAHESELFEEEDYDDGDEGPEWQAQQIGLEDEDYDDD
ncbi:ATP-dependent zinc metalloprotease FtsH [Colletotrichum fructicola]|nr:ATP-dependent zinc metalloprotease FtsH [Colletotrichum fructicola]